LNYQKYIIINKTAIDNIDNVKYAFDAKIYPILISLAKFLVS